MTDAEFDQLYIKAGQVFSPAQPIAKKDLFAGRIAQIARVVDSIGNKGEHAIIYGERGVGKTSLANIINETLEGVGLGNYLVSKCNCDSNDDFTTVWRKSLRNVIIMSETQSIGFDPITKQYSMSLAETLDKNISPDKICNAFIKTKTPVVFIFDEFDRIKDRHAIRLFTDTMKSISDNLIDATLILVGVADSVNDLLGEHESIARSLRQIKIPRMTSDELKQILANAFRELNITISDREASLLVNFSQGLPHYTHLLGLNAVRAAALNRTTTIEIKQIEEAIRKAVGDAQQTVIDSYVKATTSRRTQHLYREVLLACALAKRDELGYFGAVDIREPLRRLTNKNYDTPTFFQHLSKFCSRERGNILTKIGEKRNFRYRFANPLLPPFIIMKSRADRIMQDEMLGEIAPWSE